MRQADVLVMGVPSSGFRTVLEAVRPYLRPWVPVLSLTKGLEVGTRMRMSEIVTEVVPGHPVGVLTGPNLAKEILAGHAAASVIAMDDDNVARAVQKVFHGDLFRLYTNEDIIGCELGGVLKNVIAIASGMADGLGAGDNTRAAVITRGLSEMTRLGIALGGQALTFSGLAGMGDLVATCISPQSRNRAVGERLGRGESIERDHRRHEHGRRGREDLEGGVELAVDLGIRCADHRPRSPRAATTAAPRARPTSACCTGRPGVRWTEGAGDARPARHAPTSERRADRSPSSWLTVGRRPAPLGRSDVVLMGRLAARLGSCGAGWTPTRPTSGAERAAVLPMPAGCCRARDRSRRSALDLARDGGVRRRRRGRRRRRRVGRRMVARLVDRRRGPLAPPDHRGVDPPGAPRRNARDRDARCASRAATRSTGPTAVRAGDGRDVVVVEVENRSHVPFAVALAIRPFDLVGAGGVDEITIEPTTGGAGRDEAHVVRIDGRAGLLLPRRPNRWAAADGTDRDIVDVVTTGDAGTDARRPPRSTAGLATAAAVLPLAHTAVLRVLVPI